MMLYRYDVASLEQNAIESGTQRRKTKRRIGEFGVMGRWEDEASGIQSTAWTKSESGACCERLKISATRRSGIRKRLDMKSLSIASFMLANTELRTHHRQLDREYLVLATPSPPGAACAPCSRLYDDRFILGLGVSHAPMVERVRGHVYDKPVPTMRRYLDGVYGGSVKRGGVAVVIAALGPLMLKLAAERTAGAVPYNVTPEHTREARAALGPDKLLAVEQKVCLETDPVLRARPRSAGAASLYDPNQLPQQLAASASPKLTSPMSGSDRFIDAMVLWGDAATIARGLRAHLEAAANQVCIQRVVRRETWKRAIEP